MLDLGRLRALHAVHTHGSVAGAAQALGYTPSAISQQVAKLERETGATLLERQGRGIALTDDALVLVRTAGEMLGLAERAEVALEERRGRPAGRLRLAAFPSAARGLMPGVLARLSAEHPDLGLSMSEVDPHLSVGLAARGEVDLALAHDWDIAPMPAPEGVCREPVGEDRCEVLVPSGHPLAARASLVLEDLAGFRWVCQPPGTVCHDWLYSTLRAVGQEPEVGYHIAEYATQVELVAAGLGIALLPRMGRGPLPDGVELRPLEPTPTRRLFAVWRAGVSRRPAVAAAVRALREAAPPAG
ncbi:MULTISPECIES: LysR family transcriptional regulator [unclassified Streptomyces]|uniref:LysR family transcriptional regulator n=1 Tax=unclassified Streptomyces TaxID=2593676 RepID=UPI002DD80D16|nr:MULTISPECIES: LysR family transcriptional regulator [unclassified Streptomyces]WSA95132.1 LysR family transcriptional regulator [Streptomyces sp. NBC_01795]WSB79554.1 LysR family transcriptional regulator [Streptomyces sp. NBC_01775]WSS12243.1 LysR family transcriptional regulator [Streptomyces sp. NBC_01186]WSS40956.1 LysR family transcriptional regulator [Streptomyces sp. NBC_01187]